MAKSDWFVNAPALPPTTGSSLHKSSPFRRRWMAPVIGGTLLAVIGLLALEVVLLKNANRRTETVPAEDPGNDATAIKDKQTKPPEEITIRPSVTPSTAPPVPNPLPISEPKKPGRPSDSMLTYFRDLTIAHLYQTYLNIGLLADGVAKKAYTAEEGKKLLVEISKVMDTLERQLAQLPEEELRQDEKKQLDTIRSILSRQRSEIKELKDYYSTSEEEYVLKFQKIHKSVWADLEKLLPPD